MYRFELKNEEGARKHALNMASLLWLAGTLHMQSTRTTPLTLATWNIYTLLHREDSDRPQRRTALITNELARYNIEIAALTETRLAGEGELLERSTGYTFY